ncbi:MAG TPA: DUF4349 domain-containing protein [Polyangia bacterium]|jgi:hypothetical protein
MTTRTLIALGALLVLASCASKAADHTRSFGGAAAPATAELRKASKYRGSSDSRGGDWLLPRAAAQTSQPGAKNDKVILIKKGSLTVIVRDARDAEARLTTILKGYDAYISARNSSAVVPQHRYLGPSEIRSITMTIKIDARRFDELLGQVKQIGSYTSESVTTEDVTLAFMDLNARLANQRKVEERLLGYLADRTKDFKSVLEIEKELSRVREQVEQLSTQLRTMENQIAYSTLTLEISVQADYVPPEKRGFGQEAGEALRASLAAMGATVRTLLIVAIAVLPWLLIGLALLYVLFKIINWASSRGKRKAPPAAK